MSRRNETPQQRLRTGMRATTPVRPRLISRTGGHSLPLYREQLIGDNVTKAAERAAAAKVTHVTSSSASTARGASDVKDTTHHVSPNAPTGPTRRADTNSLTESLLLAAQSVLDPKPDPNASGGHNGKPHVSPTSGGDTIPTRSVVSAANGSSEGGGTVAKCPPNTKLSS